MPSPSKIKSFDEFISLINSGAPEQKAAIDYVAETNNKISSTWVGKIADKYIGTDTIGWNELSAKWRDLQQCIVNKNVAQAQIEKGNLIIILEKLDISSPSTVTDARALIWLLKGMQVRNKANDSLNSVKGKIITNAIMKATGVNRQQGFQSIIDAAEAINKKLPPLEEKHEEKKESNFEKQLAKYKKSIDNIAAYVDVMEVFYGADRKEFESTFEEAKTALKTQINDSKELEKKILDEVEANIKASRDNLLEAKKTVGSNKVIQFDENLAVNCDLSQEDKDAWRQQSYVAYPSTGTPAQVAMNTGRNMASALYSVPFFGSATRVIADTVRTTGVGQAVLGSGADPMAVMQKIIKKMENDFDALAQEPEKIKQLYGNISKAERSALEIIEKKASYYIEMTSRDDHAILIEKLRKFIDEKRSLWQRLMSYCDRRKARYLIIRLSKSKNETKQEYTNEAAAFLHSKKLPK